MAGRIVEAVYVANIDDLKVKMAQAAAINDKAGASLGDAFTKGSAKAGTAIKGLSVELGKLDVAGAGSLGKFSAALNDVNAKSKTLVGTLASLGKGVAIGGLAAFAAATYEGVKGATALQQQMLMIHTQAGASTAEVKNMTAAVLNMASSVGTKPEALAQAIYHIESAGYRGATALNMLKVAAEGSKVGNADLTDTAQTLAAAIYSNIPGAQNLQQAMGALNATVGAGDMTMQQLNEAFQGPMLAVVKGYGLSIKDVGAALADFGDLNIRGADAATQLRMAVQYMAKPAATAGPMLAALGLNTQSFANAMRNGGLLPALDLLKDKLTAAKVPANEYAQVISDLFSKKGSAGVEILVNSLGRLDSKYKDISKGEKSFGADWTATTKNLAFEWSQVEAGAAAFADKLGGYLIPKLKELGEFAARNKGTLEDLAKVFSVVLAGAVSIFATQKVGQFVGGVGRMVNSMGTAVLKSQAMRAGIVTDDGAIVTSMGLVDAGAASMAGAFATAAVGIVASLAAVAAPLAGLIAAYKIYEGFRNNSGVVNIAPTGNLSKATNELNNSAFGTLAGKNSSKVQQAAAYEVQQYLKTKGARLPSGILPGGRTPAFPTALGDQAAFGAVGSSAGGGGGGANSAVNGALGGGSSTVSTALTKAQIALENIAVQFNAMVKVASSGGTSRSQQGKTLAALMAATGGRNGSTEAGLVSQLNASGNPTLTRLASTIQSTWQTATAKIVTVIDADTTAGQSEIQKLQSAQNSSSLASIKNAVTGEAKTSFSQLVKEETAAVAATHDRALKALVANLENNWRAATAALKAVNSNLKSTLSSDASERASQILSAKTTGVSNASQAANSISGLSSQQSVDAMNAQTQAITDASKISQDQMTAAAQAITDAAKLAQDAANAQVQAAQDLIQSANDAANAQVAAINDSTQIQVDKLGERGLYGLNLQAQQDKVALDVQKQTDDAAIAASQAHLDQVTAQENAATAIAQQVADQSQAATDANTAQAGVQLDIATQNANATNAIAQQAADTQAIVSATQAAQAQAAEDIAAGQAAALQGQAQQITDAAMYGTQQQQQAAAAQAKALQSQSDAITASAAATEAAIEAAASGANQNAQNAAGQAAALAQQQIEQAQAQYDLTAGQAAIQNANAQAALAAQMSQAQALIAQATAQLDAITNSSAISEAQLQSIFNITNEMAQVQFGGSGTNVFITGLALNDAAAVGEAFEWLGRTQIVAPVSTGG